MSVDFLLGYIIGIAITVMAAAFFYGAGKGGES